MPQWRTIKDFPVQAWQRWPFEKGLDTDENIDNVTAHRFTLHEPFEFVTLPAGWKVVPGYMNANSHVFVLKGQLTVGEKVLGPSCYSYIPSGVVMGTMFAEDDTAILWWSPQPITVYTLSTRNDPLSKYTVADFIPCIDVMSLPSTRTAENSNVTEQVIVDDNTTGVNVRVLSFAGGSHTYDIDECVGGFKSTRVFCLKGRFRSGKEYYVAGSFRETGDNSEKTTITTEDGCSFLVVYRKDLHAVSHQYSEDLREAQDSPAYKSALIERAMKNGISSGISGESLQALSLSHTPPRPSSAPSAAPSAPSEAPSHQSSSASGSGSVAGSGSGAPLATSVVVRPLMDDLTKRPNEGDIPEELQPVAGLEWKGPSTHMGKNSKVQKSWLVARFLMKKREQAKR